MKTWRDSQKTRARWAETAPASSSVHGPDHADILLSISRRLINAVKVKNILQIEAGMEMMALALSISSEVRNIDLSMAIGFISLPEQWGFSRIGSRC
jgi:hypothetical protein